MDDRADRRRAGGRAGLSAPVRILLPLPVVRGGVNAWLLRGDPVTLVDCGPRLPASRDALEAGLAGQGLRIEDVEQLVLTHHHWDHAGLAGEVAARSSARVVATAPAADRLHDTGELVAAESAATTELLRRHGAPDELGRALARIREAAHEVLTDVAIDAFARDGDRLEAGGRSWEVLHVPGHSSGDLALHDPRTGTLIAGDVVLPGNPTHPLRGVGEEWIDGQRPMVALLRSLERLRGLAPRALAPGHGPLVDEPCALIDRRITDAHERAGKLRVRLAESPASAWELTGTDPADALAAYPRLLATLADLDLVAAG